MDLAATYRSVAPGCAVLLLSGLLSILTIIVFASKLEWKARFAIVECSS